MNFVLPVSATPPAQSTYDIMVKTPAGVVTYTDSNLLTYVAPTATVQGSATYEHLLDEEGRWEFSLTSGTDASYTVVSKILIYAMTPVVVGGTTTIQKQVTVGAPNAPSNLVAVAAGPDINLTWTDNSNYETGFVVERSLTAVGGYSVIDTIAIDAVAYTDTTGEAFTTYYYRIGATNVIGTAYSNVDSATAGSGFLDPFYSELVLHVTAQGDNLSTTFIDDSPYQSTVTTLGTTSITTSTDPFADSRGVANPTTNGDYLTTPYLDARYNWFATDYTVEAWVYEDTSWSGSEVSGLYPLLVGNMNPAALIVYWAFGVTDQGRVKLYFWSGSANNHEGTAVMSLNTWHHIAMTHNATTKTINLFIDGVLDYTAVYTTGPTSTETLPLVIGQLNNTTYKKNWCDLRITQSERYPATGFTPPTERIKRVGNLVVSAFYSAGNPTTPGVMNLDWVDVNKAPIWEHYTGGVYSVPSAQVEIDFAAAEYLSITADISARFLPSQFATEQWSTAVTDPFYVGNNYDVTLNRFLPDSTITWWEDQGVLVGDPVTYYY
jgi:hypothetical protein